MSETDLKKGREMRRNLLGDAYVDNIAATTYKDPMMQKFIELLRCAPFAQAVTHASPAAEHRPHQCQDDDDDRRSPR